MERVIYQLSANKSLLTLALLTSWDGQFFVVWLSSALWDVFISTLTTTH
jgi:hypothetical protein